MSWGIRRGQDRGFACGCSDESRARAEGWLKEVLPGLDDEKLSILTGKMKTMRYRDYMRDEEGNTIRDDDGKPVHAEDVTEHVYPERRHMDLTETLLTVLDEEGVKRERAYSMRIATDQWCGLSVTGRAWRDGDEREETHYGAQYDYGLLPYALAAVVLQIREEEPVPEEALQ